MNNLYKFLLCALLTPVAGFAQSYTSYFTGSTTDVVTIPVGGACLMGGATESDNAMRWFLRRANGGDVLVLRASGSNGYNNYLYTTLGVPVNSVETIVCTGLAASSDPYVLRKIQNAEAIWFAGGDQWTYISNWRNTPVMNLVNQAIQQRHVVVGGTSAGMAIQGKYYFSAQNGTVTSATALANPFNAQVAVDSAAFIKNNFLTNVITDTHFDNPDRRGRMAAFLARIFTGYGVYAKGIACDEYTAVCVDEAGMARVFGNYPTSDDNAYFIQSNCELPAQSPENCAAGSPLTWNRGGQALKVYRIKGDVNGTKTFNLNDWRSGIGGAWLHWSVAAGSFAEQSGNVLNCSALAVGETAAGPAFKVYPNPASDKITISVGATDETGYKIAFYNSLGQEMTAATTRKSASDVEVSVAGFERGIYYLVVSGHGSRKFARLVVRQ